MPRIKKVDGIWEKGRNYYAGMNQEVMQKLVNITTKYKKAE